MSTLHLAEAIAGEFIAADLAVLAGIWAWRRWREAGRRADELARLEDDEE